MTCLTCNGEGVVRKTKGHAPDGDDLMDVCPSCLGDGLSVFDPEVWGPTEPEETDD